MALKAGRPGYTEETVSLRPPVPEPIRLALEPTARVSGRVLDEEDQPVVGADVALGSLDGVGRATGPSSELRGADVRARTRTDTRGRFGLSEVPPGTWKLDVWAEDHAPVTFAPLKVEAGESLPNVEVTLRRGARLTGHVSTPEGTPVFDARVLAAGQRVVTREDGGFELPRRIPPGTHRIEAEHPDFGRAEKALTIDSTAEQEEVELFLEPRLVLAGRVVDLEGRSVGGSSVILRRQDTRGSSFKTADGEGRFVFRNVEPGRYSIVVRDGSTEGRLELTLEDASVENLELVLQPGGRIRGRVLGLTSDQLRAVSVSCRAPERPDGCRLSVTRTGEFNAEHVPLGTWTVVASIVGAERRVAKTVILTPEGREKEVELEFGDPRPVSGRVFHNGKPLIHAEIRLKSQGALMAETRTDWRGEFTFEQAASATAIEVIPESREFHVVTAVQEALEGAVQEVQIRTGTVTGVVTGPAGEPVVLVELMLIPVDSTGGAVQPAGPPA